VAIGHSLAAGDFERAAELVEMAVPAMRRDRREATLRVWLEMLPDDLFHDRPVLSIGYVGALLATNEVEGVEARLRDAERWVDAAADRRAGPEALPAEVVVVDEEQFRRLPGWVAVYRAGQAMALGDASTTVTHAQRALDLLDEDDLLGHGAAAALMGLASWANGDLEAAYEAYADCTASLHRAGHISDVLGCTVALADIRIVQGRLGEAMRTYEQARQLAPEQGGLVLRGTADMYVGMSAVHREREEDACWVELHPERVLPVGHVEEFELVPVELSPRSGNTNAGGPSEMRRSARRRWHKFRRLNAFVCRITVVHPTGLHGGVPAPMINMSGRWPGCSCRATPEGATAGVMRCFSRRLRSPLTDTTATGFVTGISASPEGRPDCPGRRGLAGQDCTELGDGGHQGRGGQVHTDPTRLCRLWARPGQATLSRSPMTALRARPAIIWSARCCSPCCAPRTMIAPVRTGVTHCRTRSCCWIRVALAPVRESGRAPPLGRLVRFLGQLGTEEAAVGGAGHGGDGESGLDRRVGADAGLFLDPVAVGDDEAEAPHEVRADRGRGNRRPAGPARGGDLRPLRRVGDVLRGAVDAQGAHQGTPEP